MHLQRFELNFKNNKTKIFTIEKVVLNEKEIYHTCEIRDNNEVINFDLDNNIDELRNLLQDENCEALYIKLIKKLVENKNELISINTFSDECYIKKVRQIELLKNLGIKSIELLNTL